MTNTRTIQRSQPPPVRLNKRTPWGAVAGTGALVIALLAVLVYAATNQGSAAFDIDGQFGAALAKGDDLARGHVDGQVEYPNYPAQPPMGGNHNIGPQQCDVYTEQIAAEHAVHSLEHGATWITYRPDLLQSQVDALAALVRGNGHRMLSPLPGQAEPIVLTAWERQIAVVSSDDPNVARFLNAYTQGPTTQEPGTACTGTSATGPVQTVGE